MVSNAREDFPEPESPVITVKESRGISISIFLRLCSLAPLIIINSFSKKSSSKILNSYISYRDSDNQLKSICTLILFCYESSFSD